MVPAHAANSVHPFVNSTRSASAPQLPPPQPLPPPPFVEDDVMDAVFAALTDIGSPSKKGSGSCRTAERAMACVKTIVMIDHFLPGTMRQLGDSMDGIMRSVIGCCCGSPTCNAAAPWGSMTITSHKCDITAGVKK